MSITVKDLEKLHQGHVIYREPEIKGRMVVCIPGGPCPCEFCGRELGGTKSLRYERGSVRLLWTCFKCHIAWVQK